MTDPELNREALRLAVRFLREPPARPRASQLQLASCIRDAVSRLETAYKHIRRHSRVSDPYKQDRYRRSIQRIVCSNAHCFRQWDDEQTIEDELRQLHPLQPNLRDVYDDILAIQDEWGAALDLRQKTIVVVTDPIVLEGINLGRMSIKLYIRPGDLSFRIHPLEPNYGRNDYFHPHVSAGGDMCEGDAETKINNAIINGSIYDVVQILMSTLTTYNSSSPYLALEDWDGHSETCPNCGDEISEDDAYSCDSCTETHCGICVHYCEECGGYYCEGCRTVYSCEQCHSSICSRCSYTCSVCGEQFCDVCLNSCEDCGSLFCEECNRDPDGRCCPECYEREEEEDDEEEEEAEVGDKVKVGDNDYDGDHDHTGYARAV